MAKFDDVASFGGYCNIITRVFTAINHYQSCLTISSATLALQNNVNSKSCLTVRNFVLFTGRRLSDVAHFEVWEIIETGASKFQTFVYCGRLVRECSTLVTISMYSPCFHLHNRHPSSQTSIKYKFLIKLSVKFEHRCIRLLRCKPYDSNRYFALNSTACCSFVNNQMFAVVSLQLSMRIATNCLCMSCRHSAF